MIRKLPIARGLQFLTGNVLSQGLAALSGLLIARWLDVADYGLYTIVTTLMGAMTVLTKGGVHLGYSAILGRVWPDMTRAAELVEAALQTRRLISFFVMPSIYIVTIVLLWINGATLGQIVAILILITIFWWADMRSRLVDQLLLFAHQTTRIQALDLFLAALRLLAVVGLHLAGVLSLAPALALGAAVALARIPPILAWIRALLPAGPRPAPRCDDLAEIRTSVRRQLPVEVYYVFQAQIVLLLMSFAGSIEVVAEYGALTRINQLLLPMNAFIYAFCVPAFARAVTRIGRMLLMFVALASLPGVGLVVIARLFPEGLLWLVGSNYADLQSDLVIATGVAMLSQGASTAWQLLAYRGWVRWSWLQVPVGLSGCALAPLVLDLGTVRGALLLQLSFSAGLAIAATADFIAATKREGKL